MIKKLSQEERKIMTISMTAFILFFLVICIFALLLKKYLLIVPAILVLFVTLLGSLKNLSQIFTDITFTEKNVTIKRLFRKPEIINYDSFVDIGVGKYTDEKGNIKKQIFFSCEVLNKNVKENLGVIKNKDNIFRFDFEHNDYLTLIRLLPENQKNMLIKSCEENLEK